MCRCIITVKYVLGYWRWRHGPDDIITDLFAMQYAEREKYILYLRRTYKIARGSQIRVQHVLIPCSILQRVGHQFNRDIYREFISLLQREKRCSMFRTTQSTLSELMQSLFSSPLHPLFLFAVLFANRCIHTYTYPILNIESPRMYVPVQPTPLCAKFSSTFNAARTRVGSLQTIGATRIPSRPSF